MLFVCLLFEAKVNLTAGGRIFTTTHGSGISCDDTQNDQPCEVYTQTLHGTAYDWHIYLHWGGFRLQGSMFVNMPVHGVSG